MLDQNLLSVEARNDCTGNNRDLVYILEHVYSVHAVVLIYNSVKLIASRDRALSHAKQRWRCLIFLQVCNLHSAAMQFRHQIMISINCHSVVTASMNAADSLPNPFLCAQLTGCA